MYSSGSTIKQVASHFGISPATLQSRFREWNIKIRDSRYKKLPKDAIILLYKNGYTIKQIAEKYNVSATTLRNRLELWDVIEKRIINLPKDELISLYKQGNSLRYIANKFNVSSKTIRDKLGSYGVFIPSISTMKTISKSGIVGRNKEKIMRMYIDGDYTAAEIGKKLRIAESTIQLALKRWGVDAKEYAKIDKEKLKKLAFSGKTTQEMAEIFGVTPTAIYRSLSRMGIHHVKKFIFTKEQDETIRSLINANISTPLALEKFNKKYGLDISYTIFSRRINELGLTKNKNAIRKKPIRGNKPYTDSEIRKFVEIIKKQRADAVPIAEIAKNLNVGVSLISRLITAYNIPLTKRVFNPDIEDKMMEMYESGMHYSKIAKKLGVKPATMLQRFSDLGIRFTYSSKSRRYRPEKIKLQNRVIRSLYSNNYLFSIKKIADILNIDKTTVRDRLKKMGIHIKSREELKAARIKYGYNPNKYHKYSKLFKKNQDSSIKKNFGVYSTLGPLENINPHISSAIKEYELPKDEVIRLYQSGKSMRYISRKYDVSSRYVSKKLDDWKILKIGPKKRYRQYRASLLISNKKENIIKDYKSGFTIKQLSEKYNFSVQNIRDKLKKWGIKIRNDRGKARFINLPKNNVIADYKSGKSVLSIAKKYKVSPPVIYKRLELWGFK